MYQKYHVERRKNKIKITNSQTRQKIYNCSKYLLYIIQKYKNAKIKTPVKCPLQLFFRA
jgi:hypothetical protein